MSIGKWERNAEIQERPGESAHVACFQERLEDVVNNLAPADRMRAIERVEILGLRGVSQAVKDRGAEVFGAHPAVSGIGRAGV